MKDFMIDLETLGTKNDSVFTNIGVQQFDVETGIMGDTILLYVDWQSALDTGRKMDASTIKWWLKQGEEARSDMLAYEGIRLEHALTQLNDFLLIRSSYPIVWGNGATFDIGMLEDAYNALGMNIPWKHYNVNDCRTVERMAREVGVTRDQFVREGTHHNALADATYQAAYISAMWRAILPHDGFAK